MPGGRSSSSSSGRSITRRRARLVISDVRDLWSNQRAGDVDELGPAADLQHSGPLAHPSTNLGRGARGRDPVTAGCTSRAGVALGLAGAASGGGE